MSKSSSPKATSPQKFAKYNRQRCILLLEKITKNLFRMFRDQETTKEQLLKRFFELKEKIDALGEVYLDTEYHSEIRKYINILAPRLEGHFELDDIRSKQMSALNRLQKLRNAAEYKRKKYRKRIEY